MSEFDKAKVSDQDLLAMMNKLLPSDEYKELKEEVCWCFVRYLRRGDSYARIFSELDAKRILNRVVRKHEDFKFSGSAEDLCVLLEVTMHIFFAGKNVQNYLWKRAEIIHRLSVEKGVSFQDIVNDESLAEGINFLIGKSEK
ncbi:MAG TPA: hypothetical protein P5056_03730 [Candidatus Paceibacterota bacterium]|nr:hypothetical protein [Candidatus Paceibacterota bacterium]